MKVQTSGVVFIGQCEVQTKKCTAPTSAGITAVWGVPSRVQIDVCGACLAEQLRTGQWTLATAEYRVESGAY
jgi:hypothetical protein